MLPNQTQPVCTHFCSIRACLQKSFYTSGKKLGILDSRNSFMAVGWLPSCCLLTLPGATGVAGCKPVSPIGLLVGGWLPPCCLLTLPGAAGVAGCRTVSPMGLLAVGGLPPCCLLTLPGAAGVAGCRTVSPMGLLEGSWLPPYCLLLNTDNFNWIFQTYYHHCDQTSILLFVHLLFQHYKGIRGRPCNHNVPHPELVTAMKATS